MLKGEKSLGGIVVWRRKPGPFSSQDVALLTALADHAAVAVENAHLFEAERLRRQEAETLRQTALALTTSLDRNQVIERILIQLRQVVPYDSASVQLLRGDRLEIVGGHGFPNLLDLLGFSFSVDGDNPNSEVVRTRAPFIVADGPAVHEEFRREPHAQAGIRSWLGVPMLVGEQLVGMIALDKREPGFYTEEHAQLALAFAAQAAIAFENARLYEETTAHTGQLASLLETSQALTSVLDLNEVLVRIGNQARALLTAEGCTIYFLEPDGETLRPVIALESYAEEVLVTPLSIYDSFNGLAVRSGQGQIFNYTGSDSRGAQIPGTPEEEECLMCIPLISKGQVIGTMSLDRPGRHAFNLEDLDLATTFASHAAIAIENARLYEETHRRAERLAVINRTARAASGTLHLDDLMETVYQEVAPLFQTDAFFIALYDEETNELDFRIRVDKGVREPPERQPVGSGLTGFVVTEKRPLLIRNLDEEQDRLPPAQPWGTMKAPPSWLGVPMQIGDRVVGVICVQAYRPHAYGEEEQVLLSIIADQVAVAVENARLFEAEQDQRELAEALEKAAAAVSSTLEFDQVLDRILEQAEQGTSALARRGSPRHSPSPSPKL
jgi:GAF domain-containing protein